jgi:3-hydroxyacyl-CoA dehydrogenase/enoyl-CoA hydratase/3-hydroxybutyryl-CoA epimerase
VEVISCARGLALGGGCEILLHSHQVIAHQHLNAGLVELGVGLIPGWGGIKEIFLRSNGDKNILVQGLKNILVQYKSGSVDYFAAEYNVNCHINMKADNLLAEAIALEHSNNKNGIDSVKLPSFTLSDELDSSGFNYLQQEILVLFHNIIDMGNVSEQNLIQMEKEKFLELAAKAETPESLSKFI